MRDVGRLPEVAKRRLNAYRAAGFSADMMEVTPRMGRLQVWTTTVTCEVDLLKEAIGRPHGW